MTTDHIKGLRRYSLMNSVQLMEAHKIQEEMTRAEKDEEELAEVGKQIEDDIRRVPALGKSWWKHIIGPLVTGGIITKGPMKLVASPEYKVHGANMGPM